MEERVDAGLGARERGRVRARGALAAHRGAALQRENRLAPRDPPGEAAETPRISERLDVEQHHLRRVVLLPPLEQVVRGDVGLVPDRHERGQSEPARVRRFEQREAERARLGREADVAARRGAGGEGGIEAWPGDGDPETVRPDQPGAVRTDEREQPLLPLGSLAADLGEAGRDHDERPHAAPERVLGRREHVLPRHRDHRQVDGIRDRRHRRIAVHAGDRRTLGVHRVRGTRKVSLQHVAEELAADRPAPGRGTDDGDALRLEERAQRGDDGGVVALLDALLELLGRRDRKLDLDDAVGQLARHIEPRAPEDAEHRLVLGQHLRDEAFDPDGGGASGQPLEQPRADPSPLLRVGDGEGRFRNGRISQADVVADRDDALTILVGQRAEERSALRPVGIEKRLDELGPESRKAVEAAVEALARERAVEVEQGVCVAVGGGRSRKVPPSRRITSTDSRCRCGHELHYTSVQS